MQGTLIMADKPLNERVRLASLLLSYAHSILARWPEIVTRLTLTG